MSRKQQPPVQPRNEMERGAAAFDEWWDKNRHRMSLPFLSGALTKFMMLTAASSSPADALKIFESCRIGVDSLEIMKQKTEH